MSSNSFVVANQSIDPAESLHKLTSLTQSDDAVFPVVPPSTHPCPDRYRFAGDRPSLRDTTTSAVIDTTSQPPSTTNGSTRW